MKEENLVVLVHEANEYYVKVVPLSDFHSEKLKVDIKEGTWSYSKYITLPIGTGLNVRDARVGGVYDISKIEHLENMANSAGHLLSPRPPHLSN